MDNASSSTETSGLSRFFKASGAIVVGTSVALFTQEPLVWQKIATELVMPIGLCWVALAALALNLWAYRFRWHAALCMAVWLAFSLFGSSFFADRLIGSLEDQFLNDRPLQMEPFDVLVVLGGGTTSTKAARNQLGSNGDRIAVAAQMYHAGKVERIILTGKNIVEIHGSEFSEPSQQAKELLISLGVDPDRLDEAGGRNTYEEMQSLAERLDPNQRIGLITSAWHLPGHCVARKVWD